MDQTTSQIPDSSLLEPISTSWFDLPLEMREIVIDEMSPKTRCRFAQCSKICEKEAKNSKNYLQGITIIDSNILGVEHTDKTDYMYNFFEIDKNRTLINYVAYIDGDKDNRKLKWTTVENGKPSEVRSKYFKEYIGKFKHSIRFVKITDQTFSLMDHNLKHLKFIEDIEINHEDVFECGYLNLNQISQSSVVCLRETNFTFEEILRFRGVIYLCKSNEFNEEAIIKYLKMWKNGKLPRRLFHLTVQIPSKVDMRKIAGGLGVFHYGEDEDVCLFQFYANHQINTEFCTQIVYIFPTLKIDFYEKIDEEE